MNKVTKQKVLLVDDQESNLDLLKAVVKLLDVEPILARSGEEALSLFAKYKFALILLDVQMPGIDGFETAEQLKKIKQSQVTPIIFLTAYATDEINTFKGYETGCVDYMTKPINTGILTSKIKIFLAIDQHRKDLVEAHRIIKQQNEQLRQEIYERKTMMKEREGLINDLQHALHEVKKLSGLLPICSHCKKIRDDKGYWNEIDAYIKDHSEAEFSHGICQECAEKYYPDLDLYVE